MHQRSREHTQSPTHRVRSRDAHRASADCGYDDGTASSCAIERRRTAVESGLLIDLGKTIPVKAKRTICKRGEQAGVALLLAIFVLLLIAVVGLAMMAASGTETSLTANYRSSTSAYYAALSGLEEGRGRLLPKNPNYLSCCMPPLGTNLPLGNVIYITNPLAADQVQADPTNFGNPAAYPDTEYAVEFPNFNPASNIQEPPSVASLAGRRY